MDNNRSLSELSNLLTRGEAIWRELDALRREHEALKPLCEALALLWALESLFERRRG